MHHIAVLGAGTMGHGIAQVCAMAGCKVRLADATEALAHAGYDRIRGNLEEGVRRGKLAPDAPNDVLGNVAVSGAIEFACDAADVIIEAVPERVDLKRDVLARAERAAPSTALLATNTSSLSIGDLQQSLARPDRFIGLHFFNPVHINRLLEIVRGPLTSDETVAEALELAKRIDKDAVLVHDSPGLERAASDFRSTSSQRPFLQA